MKNKGNLIEARAHIQDAWEALHREIPSESPWVKSENCTFSELLSIRSAMSFLNAADDHMNVTIVGTPSIEEVR